MKDLRLLMAALRVREEEQEIAIVAMRPTEVPFTAQEKAGRPKNPCAQFEFSFTIIRDDDP